MSETTVLFYTANQLHNPFFSLVRGILRRAAGDRPIISVSQKPMPWFGQNICVGDIGRSHLNLYRQILIAARAAQTPYVACCEDDIFYHETHFDYTPKPGILGYNLSKWSLMTWENKPVFSFRDRRVVNSLICERNLLVQLLEERFAKFAGVPDDQIPIQHWGDPGRYEAHLGVTVRPTECFYSKGPNVVFNHEEAFAYSVRGARKAHGPIQARDVPYWGIPKTLIDLYRSTTASGMMALLFDAIHHNANSDGWARGRLADLVSEELEHAGVDDD